MQKTLTSHLVLTILANDRPGIVERIAHVLALHQGNWTESSMTRLGGKFAGLLMVDISTNRKDALVDELGNLGKDKIRVHVEESIEGWDSPQLGATDRVRISIVANDRHGIVGEIASLLAAHEINLESLDSYCESAPMAASNLFHARADLTLPASLSRRALSELLESLSDDLMMEIHEEN